MGMQQILSSSIGLLIGYDLEMYYQTDNDFLIIRCFLSYLPWCASGFPKAVSVRAHIVARR